MVFNQNIIAINIPAIYVCPTTHHSLYKLLKFYPNITDEMVKSLYFKNGRMSVLPDWIDDIDLVYGYKT